MRISDWSSDVCSSDLFEQLQFHGGTLITMCCEDGRKCRCGGVFADAEPQSTVSSESNRLDRALRSLQIADDPTRIDKEGPPDLGEADAAAYAFAQLNRSEEHTSELQSLMRHSYDCFCLQKNKQV